MSTLSKWLKGGNDGSKKAEQQAQKNAKKQQESNKKQEAMAAETLAGLVHALENPPKIDFPKMPDVARMPSETDPEVRMAQKRKKERKGGGRHGAGATGLVGRA